MPRHDRHTRRPTKGQRRRLRRLDAQRRALGLDDISKWKNR